MPRGPKLAAMRLRRCDSSFFGGANKTLGGAYRFTKGRQLTQDYLRFGRPGLLKALEAL